MYFVIIKFSHILLVPFYKNMVVIYVFYGKRLCILIVVYVLLLLVYVFLSLSMSCLCILRRGYPD